MTPRTALPTKLALAEKHTQPSAGLEQFRNYCGPIKIARCGFPWEKTTKRPVASRISCIAALAEDNYVRLSSRKVACSSVVPPTFTGNPGSIYTNCELLEQEISERPLAKMNSQQVGEELWLA